MNSLGNIPAVQSTGCTIGSNASTGSCWDPQASAAAVAAADAVVLFVGLDEGQEAEGQDKTSLKLPGTQVLNCKLYLRISAVVF